MLIGTDTVKPDTWILTYLRRVLARPVNVAEASALLNTSTAQPGKWTTTYGWSCAPTNPAVHVLRTSRPEGFVSAQPAS